MSHLTKRFLRTFVTSVLSLALLPGIGACGFGASDAASQTAAATQPATATPTPTETTPQTQTYTDELFLTGDLLMHKPVYTDGLQADGTYNYTSMFTDLSDMAQGYDLKYYNQESILGGTQLGLSSYPCFNSPQEAGDAMVADGFNLVSTANNHSLDKGEAGIQSSVEYWKKQEKYDVHMAGTYESADEQDDIHVYAKNGITYSFLSWTYGCNGLKPPSGKDYLVDMYPDRVDEMLNQVREADQRSDVVIVAMHWGIEYQFDPSDEQKTLAQQLADAGADIIIGNHPHVIEPVQWLNDGKTICYYAMGNMISSQREEKTRIGMVGGVTITKTVTDGTTTDVKVSNARADLIYTYYDSAISNFKVIPFDKLDDAHLANHDQVYAKYTPIITQMDPNITVGGIRLAS